MPQKTPFLLIPIVALFVTHGSFLFDPGIVSAQAPDGKGKAKGAQKSGFTAPAAIRELKPNLYMVSGLGGNTTVRVTPEGLIVVDTKILGEQNYQSLMEVIRSKTSQPARIVVVTHVHQDHSGNAASFLAAGAQVIAHESVKTALATSSTKGPSPAPPSITYATDYTVKLGGAEAVLHHYGPSHTAGDTVVHFPDLRLVASGDTLGRVHTNKTFNV